MRDGTGDPQWIFGILCWDSLEVIGLPFINKVQWNRVLPGTAIVVKAPPFHEILESLKKARRGPGKFSVGHVANDRLALNFGF
jgi:hypothetical protein